VRYAASLSAPLSVRDGPLDKMSRPFLGRVVTVPWEISVDGDVVLCGGALFGEGDDGSLSGVVSGGGS
jgi:hypothetical protein